MPKRQWKENNKKKTIKTKRKKRNIICFNPPYSKSVKTNIGRIFKILISKYVPPNHKSSPKTQ